MIASNDADLFSDAMHLALELEHPDTSPEYQARLRLRRMLRGVISDTVENYDLDALIFPFSTLQPQRIDTDQPRAPGGTNSLASNNGLPSIILPGGYTSDNLPIGIEFINEPFADLELLKVAAGAEKAMSQRKLPITTPSLKGEAFEY